MGGPWPPKGSLGCLWDPFGTPLQALGLQMGAFGCLGVVLEPSCGTPLGALGLQLDAFWCLVVILDTTFGRSGAANLYLPLVSLLW